MTRRRDPRDLGVADLGGSFGSGQWRVERTVLDVAHRGDVPGDRGRGSTPTRPPKATTKSSHDLRAAPPPPLGRTTSTARASLQPSRVRVCPAVDVYRKGSSPAFFIAGDFGPDTERQTAPPGGGRAESPLRDGPVRRAAAELTCGPSSQIVQTEVAGHQPRPEHFGWLPGRRAYPLLVRSCPVVPLWQPPSRHRNRLR
jgi:hypothetical protein